MDQLLDLLASSEDELPTENVCELSGRDLVAARIGGWDQPEGDLFCGESLPEDDGSRPPTPPSGDEGVGFPPIDFNEAYAESTCSDGEEFRPLEKLITRAIQQSHRRRSRWVSDVCPNISLERCEELADTAQRWAHETQGVVAVVWHPEGPDVRHFRRRDGREIACYSDDTDAEFEETETGHAHVYHCCRPHNNHCRCRFFEGFRRKSRRGRRLTYGCEVERHQIWNWLQYFTRSPRRFVCLQIGKNSYTQEANQIRNIRGPASILPSGFEESMEAGEFPWYDATGRPKDQRRCEGSLDERDQSNATSSTAGSQEVSLGRFVPNRQLQNRIKNHNRLVSAIEQFLCVPLYSTCELEDWVNDENLNFFNKSDPDYKRAINTVCSKIVMLNIDGLWNLSTSTSTRKYWYSRHPDYYMDLDSSYVLVTKLLHHQYGRHQKDFLKRLLDITEKRIPKKNCMNIVGPPNSGKSWFFDMVCAYHVNVGHVANFVRSEAFPLNDCVNRRILLWNEPSIAPSCEETVKMLAGGDPCPANIKYQGHSVIPRTPLLVTSNNKTCLNTPDFESRVYNEEWKCAPFLKNVKKYPHPLTYYKLVQ